MTNVFSLLIGWVLDLIVGDPQRLPHPVVWFGKWIAFGEKRLNKGDHRKLKGALLAVFLITAVFTVAWLLRNFNSSILQFLNSRNFNSSILQFLNSQLVRLRFFFDILIVFYCLAGTTLIREVREVFRAVDRSLEEGRAQVARIVGRDTSELSAQEVRTAALETLAENLSDGVIAPLFWLALLGTPGMLAYKMVNTLDSMIGYRTERYRNFGCWAAHIDDVANFFPARLTALLMICPSLFRQSKFLRPYGSKRPEVERLLHGGSKLYTLHSTLYTHKPLFTFVRKHGRCHASPNSGYPEAALAGILGCRFGGTHTYFGQVFEKPFIGENDRELTTGDMQTAIRVNRRAEVLMVVLTAISLFFNPLAG